MILHDAGSHAPDKMPAFPAGLRHLADLCAATPQGMIHGSALAATPQESLIKQDCLILMGAEAADARRAAFVSSGMLAYRQGRAAFAFLDDWQGACADPRLLTDEPDRHGAPNPAMRRHAQEEAIASILVHRHAVPHFDLKAGAPDLLDAIRKGRRQLVDPEAHVASILWILDQSGGTVQDGLRLLRHVGGREPARIVRNIGYKPVLEAELRRLGKGWRAKIVTAHLRHVVTENRVLSALLHGLKDMPELRDDFWQRATTHANRMLTELIISGGSADLVGMQRLIRQAITDTLDEMPHLSEELLGACIWARLDLSAREVFRVARGAYRTEEGNEAMESFVARIRAQGFPQDDLLDGGDLEEFTNRMRRLLMDWLLLDHL
ncbi:hypothetical protein [Paracoccus sp. (in: a-proteobacteria)]|uniref:hypothetical protein n=1 Tax=Paracoccus sp. TaxID=267 RepID=UPI00272A973D|nr:hypothetical protein [Paracoccus sp. (in: a-proteobacteria)]